MRRFIYSILTLATIIIATACSGNGSKKLDMAVEKMNSICPVEVPMVGTVNAFVVDDNNIVIVCDVTNENITYDDIKANEDSVREQVKPAVINMTHGKLFDVLRETNAGIVYRYQWPDGKKVDIGYTYAELEEMSK